MPGVRLNIGNPIGRSVAVNTPKRQIRRHCTLPPKGWAGQGFVQIWNGPGQFGLKRDRIIENLWQGGVLYPEFHRPAVWKQEGEIQGMGSQYIILIDEGYVMLVSCLNRCV